MRTLQLAIGLTMVIFATAAISAEIHVPGDYETIQAAINAASSGDTIYVAADRYKEILSINKSITLIGAGATSTTVYFWQGDQADQSPIVTIEAPSVKLQGLEFNGGEYNPTYDDYEGVSRIGISATNTNLELRDVYVNQFVNKHVRVSGGSLDAKDVTFDIRHVEFQCDLGFELNGCEAIIDNLRQEDGYIDHTVAINEDASFGPADVTIQHSVIMATYAPYGDCIRSRQDVNLTVYDCTLYRNPGSGSNDLNTGVNVSAYNTDATITQSHFSGMPTGLLFGGSLPNSNRVVVEKNSFTNCTKRAVLIGDTHYEGIDLGQGAFGSIGQNTFSNPTVFDVELNETEVDIHAALNSWSYPYPNIGVGIWDADDDPSLGKVIYQWKPLRPHIKAWNRVPIIPELMWDPVGGSPIYNLEVSNKPNFKTTLFQASVMTNYVRLTERLPLGEDYFWRVQSKNSWGTSKWSKVGSFSVESINLSRGPKLLSPKRDSVLSSVVPILTWNAIRNAVSYHLQVSTDREFRNLISDNTEISDSRDVLAPLRSGTTYYWRVRAITKSGLTDWSPISNFTISRPSPASPGSAS